MTSAVLEALGGARQRTLGLVEHLDDEALERVVDPLMSPLAWDLGHIAAYEDLWIAHRAGGRELLRGDHAEAYDAFQPPRTNRAEAPYLRHEDALPYEGGVPHHTLEVVVELGAGGF